MMEYENVMNCEEDNKTMECARTKETSNLAV